MGVNIFEGTKANRVADALESISEKFENLVSPGAIAEDVTAWLDENITNPDSPPLDRSLQVAQAAAPADLVGDLKSAIDDFGVLPNQQATSSNNDDLDISDKDGNVLARFVGGHIKTKYFDSEDIEVEAIVDSESVTGEQTLDIADRNGNVLVRFSDGEIQTKKFNSSDHFVRQRVTYTKTVNDYSGRTSVVFDQKFKTGDKLMFHAILVGSETAGNIASQAIDYVLVDSNGVEETLCSDYGYNYPTALLEKNAEKIKVYLPDGLSWGNTRDVKIFIYQYYEDPVIVNTIKVKRDGSADFTSIRSALDSIKDNNFVTRYIIEVFPGTYNVLDDFTEEEIESEDFVGLMIGSGITLCGIGQTDDVVINGTLSPDDYETSTRNKISTLNINGIACGIENMTILADHIRYCIHDDFSAPEVNENGPHVFKDLIMHAHDLTSNQIYDVTYGAGFGNSKNGIFENVDFGDVCLVHGKPDLTSSPFLHFMNCKARLFSCSEQEATEPMYFTFDSCKAVAIRMNMRTAQTPQTLRINGSGTDCIVDCYSGGVYGIGQCHRFERSYNFAVGQAVKIGTNYNLSATADINDLFGIVLGKLDGYTYVQCGGYLNSNTFGISSLSVGDYLTLDGNGVLTDGGTASNAVGIVISTSTFEGGAIIKMI